MGTPLTGGYYAGKSPGKRCFWCSESLEKKLVDRISRFVQCRGSIPAITHSAEPCRIWAFVRVAFTAVIGS